MIQRTRVLLLITHLGGGGAEKVFALLARELSREKYDLHLGLVTQSSSQADEGLRGVTIHALGATRVRSAALPLLGLIRGLRPQVIVSGMFHLNFLVLLLRPLFPGGSRVLVRQNGMVSASLAMDGLPSYTRLLYRLLYRRADRVICQTAAMADDLAGELGAGRERLVVLANPLDGYAIQRDLEAGRDKWTGPGPHLLALGRLSKEKGFDLLLEAFASVRRTFPTADLLIGGTGSEDAALKAQCRALELESAVRFAGRLDHPAHYFRDASVFVLSSRHEGMPNALLEAAAAGVPIVALPASGGVESLLREQPGAWLATEVSSSALAASLREALTALKPGQRFAHRFIEPFGMERAIRAYEELIDATIQEGRP